MKCVLCQSAFALRTSICILCMPADLCVHGISSWHKGPEVSFIPLESALQNTYASTHECVQYRVPSNICQPPMHCASEDGAESRCPRTLLSRRGLTARRHPQSRCQSCTPRKYHPRHRMSSSLLLASLAGN